MFSSSVIVLGALALSSNAMAESSGFGTDTIQLLPTVSVGGEYRSNLYLDEGEAGGGRPVVPGTALLVNPTFALKVNSNALSFRLGSGYGARKYLQQDLQNLNSFNDGRIMASGRLLPKSPVGIAFSESFSSNNRPVNQPKAESALIRVYDNKTQAGLSVGSSQVLDINLSGIYNYRQINGMKDSQGVRDIINQRNTFGGAGTVAWKFLPKTKVLLDGSYAKNDWLNNTIDTSDGTTTIDDSTMWSVQSGLEGQVSAKTLLRLMAGSGGSQYGDATTGTSLTGLSQKIRLDAGVRIKPNDHQDVRLEYKRAFEDVYFTNYNLYHQIGLTYEVTMQDRATLGINTQYRNDNYDGPVDRTDHRVQAGGTFGLSLSEHGQLEAALTWRRLASADGIAAIEYDDVGVILGYKWGM